MARLADILEKLTVPGELCESLDEKRVRCVACANRCLIPEGSQGACKVRFNRDGVLYVPFGYVAGAQCDPIEKKPFFHVLPGGLAYSFGMLGCNLRCDYCQNWITSQVLRDPNSIAAPMQTNPSELVEAAHACNAAVIVSTYNEPLITSEWSVAVFKQAKASGLTTGYVSNGNGSPEVLQYLQPWLDLCKVDLKCFNDGSYRRLGGSLGAVLDTIRSLHAMGIWVEIVTLLVPGFNDSPKELAELTEFIADVSPQIPWHVTAFHKDYRMVDPENTTAEDLLKAAAAGRKSGLEFVYTGNLPGKAGRWENTYCPRCEELLIERRGYRIVAYRLTGQGSCPRCAVAIAGRWSGR